MEKAKMLDIYSDYLISSFSYTTATGLSRMTDDAISHDQITRFLKNNEFTSKDLWEQVKLTVRKIERFDGVISLDDTYEEKHYTDENEIICWHYDHCLQRNIKGVNILSAVYSNDTVSIPLAYEIIKKELFEIDKKTGKEKRKSSITKNELARRILEQIVKNQVVFKYVTADIFFGSKDNMKFTKKKLKKDFIFAIKSNRLVALSKKDKLAGHFNSIESLNMSDNSAQKVWLKGLDFPVILVKQVFRNQDGTLGVRYLACSDLKLNFDQIVTFFKKRWKVEEYHKSIKSNIGLAKSPTKTILTQSNHFFLAIYSFFKLEMLKIKTKLNHFSLKSLLYVNALKESYRTLQVLRASA